MTGNPLVGELQKSIRLAKTGPIQDGEKFDYFIIMKTDTTHGRGTPEEGEARILPPWVILGTRPLPTRRQRQNLVPQSSKTRSIENPRICLPHATHWQACSRPLECALCLLWQQFPVGLATRGAAGGGSQSGAQPWACLQEPSPSLFIFLCLNKRFFCSHIDSFLSQEPGGHLTRESSWTMLGQGQPSTQNQFGDRRIEEKNFPLLHNNKSHQWLLLCAGSVRLFSKWANLRVVLDPLTPC